MLRTRPFYLLKIFILEAVLLEASGSSLKCLSPAKLSSHQTFYQCEDPIDFDRVITVDVEKDKKVDVKCNGIFTCADFPKILPGDVGVAHTLSIEDCAPSLTLDCAINALEMTPAQVTALTTSTRLNLLGLPELKVLNLYYYTDEDEDCIPAASADNLTSLVDLSIFKSKCRLRGSQLGRMPGLSRLEIIGVLDEVPAHLFEGLNRTKILTIRSNHFGTFANDSFTDLISLEVLDLSSNKINTLPGNAFAHLSNLKKLDLDHNAIANIDKDVFKGLRKLEKLNLSVNNISVLSADVFIGLDALIELNLSHNRLTQLHETLFWPLVSLQSLFLVHNQISLLPENFLKYKKHLRELWLSSNNLTTVTQAHLSFTPELINLQLDHNRLYFDPLLIHSPFQELLKLKTLNLSHNNISAILSEWRYILLALQELDLSYNNITGVLNAESASFSNFITVNMEHNGITNVVTRKLLEGEDARTSQLLLSNNPFVCDCQLYDLLRAAGEPSLGDGTRYDLQEARCAEPAALAGSPVLDALNSLECELTIGCPSNCTCTLRGSASQSRDAALYMTCSTPPTNLTGLTEDEQFDVALTQLRNIELRPNSAAAALLMLSEPSTVPALVSTLNCSGLGLTAVPAATAWRRGQITELDLRNNNLTAPPLLDQRAPRLWLNGNQFQCTCANREPLVALAAAHAVVQDYSLLRCANDGGSLAAAAARAARLCDVRVAGLVVGALAVFALVALIAAVLMWRFSLRIRLLIASSWLFARCLDADDLDCEWDAFVSYSHLDEKFVVEELVPALERAPRPRSLCLHYRDWRAGDAIAANVARSVERSRHTVVVLSSNFLSSEWGRLEVRAAVANALKGRRTRVLIVLLEDVAGDPRLDAEMRAYLATHTYLRRDDGAFWSRLRLAVPARVRRRQPAPDAPRAAASPAAA